MIVYYLSCAIDGIGEIHWGNGSWYLDIFHADLFPTAEKAFLFKRDNRLITAEIKSMPWTPELEHRMLLGGNRTYEQKS